MRNFHQDRREFVRLMLSIPVALSLGLKPEVLLAEIEKAAPRPEEALRKLIYLLGPWTEAERKKAEDFAGRFIAHASGPYLPGSEGSLKSLAQRLSSEAMAVENISLKDLPPKERKLLMRLLGQLYTFVEVRFDVSKEPPWGECQTDRLRYTRAPE